MAFPANPAAAARLRYSPRALAERFWLRFHVSLIILFAWGCGFITAKSLYVNGVESMMARYSIALVAVYLAFLLGVRFWIWYAVDPVSRPRRADSGSDSIDGGGRSSRDRGSGDGSSSRDSGVRGGGGASGGAGASGAFFAGDYYPQAHTMHEVYRAVLR